MFVLSLLNFLDWFNKPFLNSTLTNFQFVVLLISFLGILFTIYRFTMNSNKKRKRIRNKTRRKQYVKKAR